MMETHYRKYINEKKESKKERLKNKENRKKVKQK